jgi:L-erythro-3,5-diaminohexanoate dehydrogenase
MIIGNGYATNHAAYALDIARENKKLLELFNKRYG